jgi:hypothetical protein
VIIASDAPFSVAIGIAPAGTVQRPRLDAKAMAIILRIGFSLERSQMVDTATIDAADAELPALVLNGQ